MSVRSEKFNELAAQLEQIPPLVTHWRSKKRLSYGDLAKETGLSKGILYRIEKDADYNPGLTTLATLATWLAATLEAHDATFCDECEAGLPRHFSDCSYVK